MEMPITNQPRGFHGWARISFSIRVIRAIRGRFPVVPQALVIHHARFARSCGNHPPKVQSLSGISGFGWHRLPACSVRRLAGRNGKNV